MGSRGPTKRGLVAQTGLERTQLERMDPPAGLCT